MTMQQGAYMRQQRRRKRGKRILATVAFVLVVCAIAAVICVTMFFGIEEITVTGIMRYSSEELVKLSQISLSDNIFAVDTKLAENRIYSSCPYIESVQVQRLLPTTIQIVVVETTPALALVSSSNHYTLLGASGRVLEQVDDVCTEQIPLVVGADFSSIPIGNVVSQKELDSLTKSVAAMPSQVRDEIITKEYYEERQQYLELLYLSVDKLTLAQHLISAASEAGFDNLSYYDVSDYLTIAMLHNDRVLVELGSELELSYKLKFAHRVIGELADNFTGTVDLSTAAANQKTYTREHEIASLMNKIYLDGYY